ncbi:MAG: hypothetical protein Q8L40_00410, partial [Burkholderiales bacterium]|nr:hypothetical protein [Burkholderiales bacterium]
MSTRFPTLSHKAASVLTVAAWLLLAAAAHAADAPAGKLPTPPKGSEFQLFIENDMLAGTDHYYTNGIKFGFGV